jgi:hypothetical protein
MNGNIKRTDTVFADLILELFQICRDFFSFRLIEAMEWFFCEVAANTHQIQCAFNAFQEAGIMPACTVNSRAYPHHFAVKLSDFFKLSGSGGII